MFGPGLFFQSLSTFVDVLNIWKSTLKILYNKSTKCLQILPVEGSAFSVPPSPTVTLVLGRSKGSAERQTWKRSCSAIRIGFSTTEKVWVSTRGQADLPCPALVLQRLCRDGGNLRYPPVPSKPQLEDGRGGTEQGAFHPQNRNCGEQGHAKQECLGGWEVVGREVLQKGGIWGGYSWTQEVWVAGNRRNACRRPRRELVIQSIWSRLGKRMLRILRLHFGGIHYHQLPSLCFTLAARGMLSCLSFSRHNTCKNRNWDKRHARHGQLLAGSALSKWLLPNAQEGG